MFSAVVPRGTSSWKLIFMCMKYRGYTIYRDFISVVAYAGNNDTALRAWTIPQIKSLIDQTLSKSL